MRVPMKSFRVFGVAVALLVLAGCNSNTGSSLFERLSVGKLTNAKLFKNFTNEDICFAAIDFESSTWVTDQVRQSYVAEAKIRGLTEQQCAHLTQQKNAPVVAAKKAPPPIKINPSRNSNSSGSGFFVSKLGHVITNQHVVKKCKSVTVGDSAKKQVAARVLETDRRNDLALLRISSMEMASARTKTLVAKLGLSVTPLASQGLLRPDAVELGEDVVVAGFPFGDIFSNTIKITKGVVSAKRGIGDDTGKFQIDAAVQPGNSGGPIYDENGNIIGVVVSQLNKLKVAKAIGSLPENVNYGIKASTVKEFLNASGLLSSWSKRTKKMSTKDIAKIAENHTVMVVCHR